MATQNLVSATISAADMTTIENDVSAIRTLLPFLIALTSQERRGGIKLGSKTVSFVDKAIGYALENPSLVPGYVNLTEIQKDYGLQKQLLEIMRHLKPLYKAIEDTGEEAGVEAYNGILGFYQAVKVAAEKDVPGAKAIYEDLSKRFPGRKPKHKKPTPTPTPTPNPTNPTTPPTQ